MSDEDRERHVRPFAALRLFELLRPFELRVAPIDSDFAAQLPSRGSAMYTRVMKAWNSFM